jgi:succinate dehydrogenase / fumarate reductase flavoprotein subunit
VKLAELGVEVDLFSMVPVKRSHSVCAQGGINACNDVARQQGYSEWQHFDETILGGDFLADQPPVLEMCNWAPRIIDLLDRMGVPFTERPKAARLAPFRGQPVQAHLLRRRHHRAATALRARRADAPVGIRWQDQQIEFGSSSGRDHEGVCVGIVAQDMRTMQIKASAVMRS